MNDINALNFSGFKNLLLEPYRVVELFPKELTNNGYAVILAPRRNGKNLDGEYIDKSTLPILNLRETNIETNQRSEKILAEVRELFKERVFVAEPQFDIIMATAMHDDFVMYLEVLKLQEELGQVRWLQEPDPSEAPDKKLERFIKDSPSKFSLSIKGGPIKGLDLTSPVKGFIMTMTEFLLPLESIRKDGAKMAAIAIHQLYNTTRVLKRTEYEKEEYIKKYGSKFWFKYWNKKKKFEKDLEIRKYVVEEMTAKISKAFTTLGL